MEATTDSVTEPGHDGLRLRNREGVLFIRELKDRESCVILPHGGFVIAHPERPPVWLRLVNGAWVESTLPLT